MRIVFCIPGRTFSSRFLQCWTNLLGICHANNIDVVLSNRYSSVVHFARAMCMGADLVNGEHQKPWQGKLDYDYMFWIDSDIVFSAEQVFAMINSPHDVTCGLYMMEDTKHYAVVKDWDLTFFEKNGSFEFLTDATMQQFMQDNPKQRYMAVDYAGMGFMCIRKGVVEKLTYPWFYRPVERLKLSEGKEWVDMCSEDTAFCHNLKDKGVQIMLDTTIRVGHEKTMVL